MSTSMLSVVDADTGNKIPLATFEDANGNTVVGHVALAGTPLVPVAPGNPLPVVDASAEAALATISTNTAAAMAAAGTPGDNAWSGTGSGTLVALLKALYGKLAGTLTTTISGITTVSGSAAVGIAPVDPPLSVSGVDASGLTRRLLTDGNGVMQVAQIAPLPAGSNTIGNVGITGTPSVSVSNFPATQAVSGTVNVGNLPATQAVSGVVALGAGSQAIGTVGVTGTVAVADSAAIASLATIAVNTNASASLALVSRSITSTVASASTSLVPANASRKRLIVQAPQSAGVWLNLLGGTAGAGLADCLYLGSGNVLDEPITNAVTYFCTAGGLVLSAWEG